MHRPDNKFWPRSLTSSQSADLTGVPLQCHQLDRTSTKQEFDPRSANTKPGILRINDCIVQRERRTKKTHPGGFLVDLEPH